MVKFYKRYVFLQALFLTIVVFIIGMYIGIAFEDKNIDKAEAYFSQSEISLMDITALNNLLDSGKISCDVLKESNFNFADKIYNEAKRLDAFEKAGKVVDNFEYIHKKYDLLRTLLWMNALEVRQECADFSTVVYIYEYEIDDLVIKAKQRVWSKILIELKEEKGGEVLLIPIARSHDFISLETLTTSLNVTSYPVVIINEEYIFYNLTSSSDLGTYIN